MADDKRLPYTAAPADTAHPLPGTTGGLIWVAPNATGAIEFRRQLKPFKTTGGFDRANGNRVTIPMTIRSTSFFKAIPCILGWSVVGGPDGSLKRRLPIADSEGMGMVAVAIPSYRFFGNSNFKPGPLDITGAIVADPQPMRTAGGLFKDDAYSSPDVFEFRNLNGGGPQDAIKQTRYCELQVQYAHIPYPLATDANLVVGNPFGANSEKMRYMWSEFVPSVEYSITSALQLFFGPTATVGLANNPAGTDAGYIRPTGELIVHWIDVPANGVALLLNKLEHWTAAGFEDTLYGTVNDSIFSVNLYGSLRNYAAETLLFMGVRTDVRFQPHGAISYDLNFHFNYRYGGWNNMLTGSSPTLEPIVRKDGSKPYKLADFNQLFRCD